MKLRTGTIFILIAMLTIFTNIISPNLCSAQAIDDRDEPEFFPNKFIKIKISSTADVAISETISRIQAAGVTIRTSSKGEILPGSIVTAEVQADDNEARDNIINNVRAVAAVDRVELSSKVSFSLHNAVDRIRADHVWDLSIFDIPITGRGVVVGIVDSGVDINHETFKDAGGVNTRLRAIWDLSMDSDLIDGASPVIAPVTGVNLGGIECLFGAGAGGQSCLEVDDAYSGHGTHVLGIAAGRGIPGLGLFRGVAPDASLVVVKAHSLYDVEVIEGINYIFTKADEWGMPAVVNLSLGWNHGPRDGTSLAEQYIDTLAAPGKIIVAAAGNDALSAYHEEIGFTQLNQIYEQYAYFYVFDFVGQGWPWRSINKVRLEGYYLVDAGAPNDILKFRLMNAFDDNPGPHYYPHRAPAYNPCDTGPNGTYVWTEFGDSFTRDTSTIVECATSEPILQRSFIHDGIISLDHTYSNVQANGKILRGFSITLTGWPGPSIVEDPDDTDAPITMPGLWTIVFKADLGTEEDLFVDLWIDSNETVARVAPTFYFTKPSKTLLVPCTANDVICVGAVENTCSWNGFFEGFKGPWTWDEPECQFFANGWGWVADWSSQGPRRDGMEKPELVAAGRGVISAFSSDRNLSDELLDPLADERAIRGTVILEGDGKYEIKTGTSMASPLVAGTVALMLQVDPDLTPDQVRSFLTSTTRPYNPTVIQEWDSRWGYGRLDAYQAVMAVIRVNGLPVEGALGTGPGFGTFGLGEDGDDDSCFITAAASEDSVPAPVLFLCALVMLSAGLVVFGLHLRKKKALSRISNKNGHQ